MTPFTTLLIRTHLRVCARDSVFVVVTVAERIRVKLQVFPPDYTGCDNRAPESIPG